MDRPPLHCSVTGCDQFFELDLRLIRVEPSASHDIEHGADGRGCGQAGCLACHGMPQHHIENSRSHIAHRDVSCACLALIIELSPLLDRRHGDVLPSRGLCLGDRVDDVVHVAAGQHIAGKQRLSNNIPETVGADIISVSELAHKLFADAKALGIGSFEIEEDTGSAYEAILDAVVHYDVGLAD